jgi:hypothetical protein
MALVAGKLAGVQTMEKTKSSLDVAVNIAILCTCILIIVIGVKKFLLSDAHSSGSMPQKGTHLRLDGVDWSRADRTIVLALSTQCHFCNESSVFYQRLENIAVTANEPLIAVFPQSVEEARSHWISQNISLAGVQFIQSPLEQLQVQGTPTLILVDRKGVVLRAWPGKQPESGEAEIIHAVRQ